MPPKLSLLQGIKDLVIGRSHSLQDTTIFHRLSLIAFFAWVGLGADGLSSSCYGPQEAFMALNGHTYLSIFVALGTVLTIFVISTSYSQIVELFPAGGGGYLVASKLLSPDVGMVSGCALLIDYVLTITVSIASGADAIFSLLPLQYHGFRLYFAVIIVMLLVILNMRGVKESVLPLVPIFLTFLITHVFIIIYAIAFHSSHIPQVITCVKGDIHNSISQVGFLGMIFLILRSYSMGAGTYTGIEAVSNGIPVLREPKVETAKRTMFYMAVSLSLVVFGLMLAYLLFQVGPQEGKTFNAILFEQATGKWNLKFGYSFVLIALLSEATLLFVAAQTGFLDGPRVLANMGKDRWFPTRFSFLSDRFVMQNGILIMGGLALLLMITTGGSVRLLVVLYSINVFITFGLSQLGMVRHWWLSRRSERKWHKKLFVNGVGLLLTTFILVSMVIIKFHEGGWITLLITGALVILAVLIKRHYFYVAQLLHRLNSLVAATENSPGVVTSDIEQKEKLEREFNPRDKTAVLLVNGFNGMGLHTLFGVLRLFGVFKNFVFVEVGVIDSGNFKGSEEVERLKSQVKSDLNHYIAFMNKEGYYAEGVSSIAVDVVEEITNMAPAITNKFPNSVFFGGKLIFPKDTFLLRFLHNHTVFALQKRLYQEGLPFVILPIRV